MRLPTILGKQLLKDCVAARMNDPLDVDMAIAAFQRMALVASLETAVQVLEPWLKPEHRVFKQDGPDYEKLKLVASVVKEDVLGLAMDSLVGIVNSSTNSTKDRLAAAAVLNELFGEKELIKDVSLSDKLVVNLVGDG